MIGGVHVADVRGLAGHSDADAVCHAVTDAVLGAAGLGDVGGLFPDTDPAWKDADSLALLRDAFGRVAAAGWRLGNLDLVVICHRPKIGRIAESIRASWPTRSAPRLTASASRARPRKAPRHSRTR